MGSAGSVIGLAGSRCCTRALGWRWVGIFTGSGGCGFRQRENRVPIRHRGHPLNTRGAEHLVFLRRPAGSAPHPAGGAGVESVALMKKAWRYSRGGCRLARLDAARFEPPVEIAGAIPHSPAVRAGSRVCGAAPLHRPMGHRRDLHPEDGGGLGSAVDEGIGGVRGVHALTLPNISTTLAVPRGAFAGMVPEGVARSCPVPRTRKRSPASHADNTRSRDVKMGCVAHVAHNGAGIPLVSHTTRERLLTRIRWALWASWAESQFLPRKGAFFVAHVFLRVAHVFRAVKPLRFTLAREP